MKSIVGKALESTNYNSQTLFSFIALHIDCIEKKKLTLSLRCVQLIRNKFAAYGQYIQVAKCLLGTSIVFGSINQTIWNEILY